MRVEVCSNCHPAYTGKSWSKKSGSRIDSFNARYKGLARLSQEA